MTAYAEKLSKRDDIEEFRCNVYLEGLTEGDYTIIISIPKISDNINTINPSQVANFNGAIVKEVIPSIA